MSGAVTPRVPVSGLPRAASATPALLAAAPTAPGLPPSSAFDLLPDLHKLFKRLLETPAPQPAPTPSSAAPTAEGPLEIQHAATAANEVQLKIQKARRAVMALPDIDRTCEDQEDEIEHLRARIAQLKACLMELGRPPVKAEADDDDWSMTG